MGSNQRSQLGQLSAFFFCCAHSVKLDGVFSLFLAVCTEIDNVYVHAAVGAPEAKLGRSSRLNLSPIPWLDRIEFAGAFFD